jgi:hypothetical protein
MLDAQAARDLLNYDPETGVLTWRLREGSKTFNARFANKPAGCRALSTTSGWYLQVGVLGKLYLAHRLAWLIVHGSWPKADLDHKDGDGTNNRLSNLREATRFENNQNRAISSRNTSGLPGATFCKHAKRWKAQISFQGQNKTLGYFDTAEDAGAAYRQAKARLHTFNPEVRA